MSFLRRHISDLLPVALLALTMQLFAGWLMPASAALEPGQICVAHNLGGGDARSIDLAPGSLPLDDDRTHACCLLGCLAGATAVPPVAEVEVGPTQALRSTEVAAREAIVGSGERPSPFAARAPPVG